MGMKSTVLITSGLVLAFAIIWQVKVLNGPENGALWPPAVLGVFGLLGLYLSQYYSNEVAGFRPSVSQVATGTVLILTTWFFVRIGMNEVEHPSPSAPPQAAAPAVPSGKVDACGRINPGTRLYSKTGVFFGTVVEQVVYDDEKQECVLVRLDDKNGPLFKLRRAAIRQGNTWFTDP